MCQGLADWLAKLRQPEHVIDAFRTRDALHGQRITWTQSAQRMSGEARGIDDAGALVVFTESGDEVRLDAGEVHLRESGKGCKHSVRPLTRSSQPPSRAGAAVGVRTA